MEQLHGFCVLVGGSTDKRIHPGGVLFGSHVNINPGSQFFSPDRFPASQSISEQIRETEQRNGTHSEKGQVKEQRDGFEMVSEGAYEMKSLHPALSA